MSSDRVVVAADVVGVLAGAVLGWLACAAGELGAERLLRPLQPRLQRLDERLHAGRRRSAPGQQPGSDCLRGLLGLTYWGFKSTPTGFIPSQDMGYLLVNVQLPDSASTERTREVMVKIEKIAHEVGGVKHTQAMTGQSMLLSANGSNFGSMFVILDQYAKRPDPVLARFFTWFKQVVKALDDRADSIDYSLATVHTADDALGKVADNAPGPGKVEKKDVYADRVHYRLVRPADADYAAIRWLKEHWGLWFRRRFDGLVGQPSLEARPLTREGRLERRIKPDAVENRVRQLGLSWTKTPSWRREVAVRVARG